MTTSAAAAARQAIRATLGDDIADRTTIEAFSSGALSLQLRRADGSTASIDGSSTGEWGLTLLPADEEAFTGHEHTATSLADLLRIVREAWLPR